MDILFLTQIVPYPLDSGPKIKTYHVLRYLVQSGHRVILATYVRPEEVENLQAMRDLCDQVYAVPIRRSRLADAGYLLRSNLTGRPFLIERDDLKAMRDLVGSLLEREHIEVIHTDQLTMSQFAYPYRSLKRGTPDLPRYWTYQRESKNKILRVFDAHNAVWTIVERMRENARWFLRPILNLEAKRVLHYEGWVVDQFDGVLAVSQSDRLALEKAHKAFSGADGPSRPIRVIPIAVDTAELQPVKRSPTSQRIVTLGTLHYPPNADGIRWFIEEVFPKITYRVPGTSVTIIGKNPPADFLAFPDRFAGKVRVTGYVPELLPYLQEAAIMVVPVRAGGGMRVRILEAFADGMPVVTTTVGLEGIDAIPEEEVLIGDSPDGFADQVTRLLTDVGLQECLARNGRRLAESRYDWKVVLSELDALYGADGREKNANRQI